VNITATEDEDASFVPFWQPYGVVYIPTAEYTANVERIFSEKFVVHPPTPTRPARKSRGKGRWLKTRASLRPSQQLEFLLALREVPIDQRFLACGEHESQFAFLARKEEPMQ